MKTFTYDEVIELMSECLNNLDEQVNTNEVVQLETYDLEMDYDNYVSVADATFELDNLYNEISIDFKERLNDLANYKSI
tara:strand:- start:43 stop:279 length:237 start_codon:yes stop_codon:yes gene_type:complete